MRIHLAAVPVLVALAFVRCGGGGGGGGPPAPATVSYATNPVSYRVGVAAVPNLASTSGGTPTSFSISPSLPLGLSFDPASGTVSGLPTDAAATADYTVTASNPGGQAVTALTLQVTPALPATISLLADGFEAQILHAGLPIPVRLAFAPDGRLLFNELQTGNIRVIDATGTLLPAPAATVSVLSGSHQGLLGLALDPAFDANGILYVYASVPASGPLADRNQIQKLTMTGNLVTAMSVIVDDLPLATLNNGGELVFGPDLMLYATIGDTNNPALAQTDGVVPGRVLRYTTTGAIPIDNPIFGDPEWCRGLRNTFGLTFHPTVGTAIGVDNGPATNDKLTLVQKGKDFGWPNPAFGGGAGAILYGWPTVIAPTSITYYTGGGFGPAYENSLFIGSYADDEIHNLPMSGAAYVDVDSDDVFARFVPSMTSNKPLDLKIAPDGSLYVSTFDSIYRIKRSP